MTMVCPVTKVPALEARKHRGAGDLVGLADT